MQREKNIATVPGVAELSGELRRCLILLNVREGCAECLHPGLPVVDSEGLPIQHVGKALSAVAHDDALTAVQAAEVVHAAKRTRKKDIIGNLIKQFETKVD